jgi:hypothetical protein
MSVVYGQSVSGMWWVGNTYQCPGTSAIVTRGLFTAKFLCVWVFGRVYGFLSAGAFFLDGEAPKPDWSRTRADCLPIANSSSSWLCARRSRRSTSSAKAVAFSSSRCFIVSERFVDFSSSRSAACCPRRTFFAAASQTLAR